MFCSLLVTADHVIWFKGILSYSTVDPVTLDFYGRLQGKNRAIHQRAPLIIKMMDLFQFSVSTTCWWTHEQEAAKTQAHLGLLPDLTDL